MSISLFELFSIFDCPQNDKGCSTEQTENSLLPESVGFALQSIIIIVVSGVVVAVQGKLSQLARIDIVISALFILPLKLNMLRLDPE